MIKTIHNINRLHHHHLHYHSYCHFHHCQQYIHHYHLPAKHFHGARHHQSMRKVQCRLAQTFNTGTNLLNETQGAEFHRLKRVNESERVIIKSTRDFAIQQSEGSIDVSDQEMKTLFEAAKFLRSISQCKNWVFTGSFQDLNSNHVPQELYSFCRWLISGPSTDINASNKSNEIHKRVMSLAQTAVSMFLTDRQKSNTKSKVIKSSRDMPHQLAAGLALRQSIRNKEIVNMLHGFGMSVEYNRLLRIEAQIEQSVLERMNQHGGMYLPENFVKNRHVFFAIDNVDFAEDTHNGKHTLHGTAMAIYQKTDPRDTTPQIRLVNKPFKIS